MAMLPETVTRRKPARKRDPDRTHARILAAAREILARDGEEGLSLAEVVARAGVNRSTAYQHFQTREKLVAATASWVSERLCSAVFGDVSASGRKIQLTLEAVTEHFARFAMENPELGRVWLLHLLNSARPDRDPFFQMYTSHLEQFAKTDCAQPGIDVQAHSVLMLAAAALWPVWNGAHASDQVDRERMVQRFVSEMRRLNRSGVYRIATGQVRSADCP